MALQKCENQDQSSKYSPVKTASVFEPCSGWKYKKPLDGMWHILTFKSDRFCLHQRGLSLKEQNQSVQLLQTHSHSAFSGLAYLPELIFFLFFPSFLDLFAQVLQMYLPFCGISISNAKLFSESRKEYERSRVRGASRTFARRLSNVSRTLSIVVNRRRCWRWSTTCLRSKPTWRRL